MSTPTNDDARLVIRVDQPEIDTLKGLIGKGILVGDWGLVAEVATVLNRIYGGPTGAPDLDDIINAARCAPSGPKPDRDWLGNQMPYARTAGDTPAGEQPYDGARSVTACAVCGAALDDANCDNSDEHQCDPRDVPPGY